MKQISIIDGQNLILGRMASIVAKRLLLGEDIAIVNSEKVVVSGKKKSIIEKHKNRLKIRTRTNPRRGPFHPRTPDKFVRRTIRGMLPWKTNRGEAVYKRLRCYLGIPDEFKDHDLETIPEADISRLRSRFVYVSEICKEIGWNPIGGDFE